MLYLFPDLHSKFSAKENNSLVAYPNPSNGNLSLQLNLSTIEAYELTVFSLLGQSVYTKNGNLTIGVNKIPVQLSNMQSGVYILNLECKSGKRYNNCR